MVSSPAGAAVEATGAFPAQNSGAGWFPSWFLPGDGWHQPGSPEAPPWGFPEALMHPRKIALGTRSGQAVAPGKRYPKALLNARGAQTPCGADIHGKKHDLHGGTSRLVSGRAADSFGSTAALGASPASLEGTCPPWTAPSLFSTPKASPIFLPLLGAGGCLGPGLCSSSLSGLSRVIAWWEVGSGLGGMNERERGNRR